MRNQWTRERIIRHLLERESHGQPLTVGGSGVDKLLYAAARRIFGSWENAVHAAGIPAERSLTWQRWTPGRILVIIRHLAQRQRPLSAAQLERRYCNMVATARRHFGSWTKAIVAAGVDPTRLQRVVPWTQERVVEAILTRELRGQSLVIRMVEPRSLVEAGQRFFGSWAAAIAASGLDPRLAAPSGRRGGAPVIPDGRPVPGPRPPRWTKERIVTAIQDRARQQKALNPASLSREENCLYHAARRHFGGWSEALSAAGIDPGMTWAKNRSAAALKTGLAGPNMAEWDAPTGDHAGTSSSSPAAGRGVSS